MKKILSVFLILCLFCSFAIAETPSVSTSTAKGLTLNKEANTFVLRAGRSWTFQIVDVNMNPLSGEYDDVDVRDGFYKVYTDGKGYGLLDGNGALLIPTEYGDVQVISDRWTAGIRLKESTSDNYDYETWFSESKKFYLIDTVDIYYNGTLKGTLPRSDWHYATPYGDYLCIQNRDKNYAFYNKDFQKSSMTPEYGAEYEDDYRSGKIIHMGSGQEAFVPGCTLTRDEVEQFVWIKDDQLLDLQGNILADLSDYYYSTVDRSTGLIKVRTKKNLHGLLDASGNVLLPCVYESIGYDLESALKLGYVYVVKDGKGGFASLKDGSEAGFVFTESAGRDRAAFIVVEDPREGTILISASAGELPGRYKEVNVPYSGTAPFATVVDMDGRVHVIGMDGEDVLPDNPSIRDTYYVEFSNDGSLILVQDTEDVYHLYQFTASSDNSHPVETNQPATGGSDQIGTEGKSETWICPNCQKENTANFCIECGSAKPVAAETWICPNCQKENTTNFCTECGTAKPVDDGTWTCENGHEGNTGKFCGTCGAPKP